MNKKVGRVILISGNKRAGKTTLSVKLQKEAGFNYYNFDNIMDAIEDEFDVNSVDEKHYISFLESFIEFMLEHAKNYEINSIIDTIYYMPKDLNNFKYKNDIEIYYLANLDATIDNIKPDFKKYSKSYDWPSYASDEDIERNVNFILERNELLKSDCSKYGYRLINTSREENRKKVIEAVFNEIVNM